MQNFGKKLAVLTLAACSFGLTQTTLAGDRITVIYSSDHRLPYVAQRHHHHAYPYRTCSDYRYRHGHTPYRYHRHHYGDHKTGSRWHSDGHAAKHGRDDHDRRSLTNTAYAKGHRY
jgi:hypothetical protein